MKETGAGWFFCAAHRAQGGGPLHGHTWEVVAWWDYDGTDAMDRQDELKAVLAAFDHAELPPALTRGENLADEIMFRLGCKRVEVSRPAERIHARVG